MSKSLAVEQIINQNGFLSIDVFKNQKNIKKTKSSLELNSNGYNLDAIKLYAPNGEINLTSNSLLLDVSKNLKINSNIFSFSDDSIYYNKKSDFLTFRANNNIHSKINIDSQNIKLISNENFIKIDKNEININSKQIHLGNLMTLNYNEKKINLNSDLIINGNLLLKGNCIKVNKIETVHYNNSIEFELTDNIEKDWSIFSSNNSVKSGLFFYESKNLICLQSDINLINLKLNSIFIGKKSTFNENDFLNINNKININKNLDTQINGNVKINGNLLINDNISILKNGTVIMNDILISNLFKFSVGKNYRFKTIQSCINFIEINQLYLNENIFIMIYPDKEYNENIVISNPNINLIGKYSKIKVRGNFNIQFESNNDEQIILKNIHFNISEYQQFKVDSNIQLFCKNIKITSDTDAVIQIKNLNKLEIKNSNLITNCNFKILNISNCIFTKSVLDISFICENKKLSFEDCMIFFNLKKWNIKTDNIIEFNKCKIKYNNNFKYFQNNRQNFLSNKNLLFFNLFFTCNKLIEKFHNKIMIRHNQK